MTNLNHIKIGELPDAGEPTPDPFSEEHGWVNLRSKLQVGLISWLGLNLKPRNFSGEVGMHPFFKNQIYLIKIP